MFAKNKVSQSMIDAVNKIMSEKEEETKEQFLSEGWDEMLKSVKDKNKPQPSGGAGKKQGSRYGGSKQKEEPEEKEVKEELKGNQHKIDKNKNNKIDAEDFKMLRKEELKGNQHKIDANKNNKIDAHDFQLLRGKKKVKEDTFAAKLLNSLDETRGAQAMKASGVKQSPDKLLHRTGMNNAHKFPRPGQTDKSNIPPPNTGEPMIQSMHKLGAKWRLDRKAQLKPAIKAALGTHGPKGKLPEEVEIDEAAPKKMDDVAKQNLEPAKKGVVGTVKSDFKNFKNFLAGKKETNEEVESLDEDRYLMKYLLSRGINPKYVDRNTRVGHAKSNEFKKWKADHLNSLIITRESNEMPFDGPYTKTKKDVKDKSGAVHTPMSRAKDLARSALKSVQDKTKIK